MGFFCRVEGTLQWGYKTGLFPSILYRVTLYRMEGEKAYFVPPMEGPHHPAEKSRG